MAFNKRSGLGVGDGGDMETHGLSPLNSATDSEQSHDSQNTTGNPGVNGSTSRDEVSWHNKTPRTSTSPPGGPSTSTPIRGNELEHPQVNINMTDGDNQEFAADHSTDKGTPTPVDYASRYNLKPGMCIRNLIVNYVPQSYNDSELYRMFSLFGPLDNVKIMKELKSGYSYGFGFVNFKLERDAEIALHAMNGFQAENKRLKVSIARPACDEIKDTNIFITNVPPHFTEEDLEHLFGQFGEIVQNRILRYKETGISRGCAFVRFDLRVQASHAIIALNGFIPEGAELPLRVKLAQDHGKQNAAYIAGYQDACLRRLLADEDTEGEDTN